jgi:diguanylate cyclase
MLMQGSYDLGLVALSYLIASLAGYVAIEFATRMRVHARNRRWWLVGGAFAMGTGIWSMHFVGMTAFSLPVEISFDLGVTVLSWLAAVVVSGLALFIVGYGRLNAKTLVLGALLMGAGVCLMHYSGMWAMQMAPGISYRPGLFALSALIAVAASGAALLIIAKLGEVETWRDILLRAGAALIMGLAVVGMHYTGMAAAIFQNGAFCSTHNQLAAAWMPWPTTATALAILGMGIYFTITDTLQVTAATKVRREQEAWVQRYAFTDRETHLSNRIHLQQLILERLKQASDEGFAVLTLQLESTGIPPTLVQDLMTAHNHIVDVFPGAPVARMTQRGLGFIIDGSQQRARVGSAALAERLRKDAGLMSTYRMSVGVAHAPTESSNAQTLLTQSTRKGVPVVPETVRRIA